MQVKKVLNSVLANRPKILTLYQGHQFLPMLSDFDVYCLVVPDLCQPTEPFPPNICPIGQHNGLEYDLAISFSGGNSSKILDKICKENKIDLIVYEMDFVYDVASGMPYKGIGDIFPTESYMKEASYSKKEVVLPTISPNFRMANSLDNRRISVCTFGNMLKETEIYSNYSDIHYIVNTIGAQIFGINPRLGTTMPSENDKVSIFNSSKIILNTKTAGYFPIEIIQAMACGCVPVSYNYPGIKGLVPEALVVNNKNKAREIVSNLLTNPKTLQLFSNMCLSFAEKFKQNYLTDYITKRWKEINESGFKFYRI